MLVRVDWGHDETEITIVGYEGKFHTSHTLKSLSNSILTTTEVVVALAKSYECPIEINVMGQGQQIFEYLTERFKDLDVVGSLI
jgi:hypothetical protein